MSSCQLHPEPTTQSPAEITDDEDEAFALALSLSGCRLNSVFGLFWMPESVDTKSKESGRIERQGCPSFSLGTIGQGSADHIHTKFISQTSSKNIVFNCSHSRQKPPFVCFQLTWFAVFNVVSLL